jgi:hypothetical protein
MKSTIGLGVFLLGFGLLILSTSWNTLFPPTSSWTNEKAERSAVVKARLAELAGVLRSPSRMHSGPDPGEAKAEFDKLIVENNELNSDFESVAAKSATIPKLLKWTGISLAAVGIVGWYAVKDS